MGQRGLRWHRWGQEPSSFPPLCCSLPQLHLQTLLEAEQRRAEQVLSCLRWDVPRTAGIPALLLRNLAGSPIGQHTEPTASEKTFPGSLEISDSDFFCLKREDLPEPFGELQGPSFMDTKEIFAAGGDDANIPAPW